jgi:hypothetical protein
MAATDFFADPDFLALLRFWDERRDGRCLPDWDGDVSRLPAEILQNLVISARRPEPRYLYVGAEFARRWTTQVTGRPVFEVLRGGHAAYARSLGQEAVVRHAPVFSAAIYRIADDLIMTGRLFAPFTHKGSEGPQVIMALQVFRGSDRKLEGLGAGGFVDEIDRRMIRAVPELCTRLDQARRLHHLSRRPRPDALAQEMAAIAQDLADEVLVSLPRFTQQG